MIAYIKYFFLLLLFVFSGCAGIRPVAISDQDLESYSELTILNHTEEDWIIRLTRSSYPPVSFTVHVNPKASVKVQMPAGKFTREQVNFPNKKDAEYGIRYVKDYEDFKPGTWILDLYTSADAP